MSSVRLAHYKKKKKKESVAPHAITWAASLLIFQIWEPVSALAKGTALVEPESWTVERGSREQINTEVSLEF